MLEFIYIYMDCVNNKPLSLSFKFLYEYFLFCMIKNFISLSNVFII